MEKCFQGIVRQHVAHIQEKFVIAIDTVFFKNPVQTLNPGDIQFGSKNGSKIKNNKGRDQRN
jgi:hypothetical protein